MREAVFYAEKPLSLMGKRLFVVRKPLRSLYPRVNESVLHIKEEKQ
jgi:hypothetical protein